MQIMNCSEILVEDVDHYSLRLSEQLYGIYSFIGITKEAFLDLIKTRILMIISDDQLKHKKNDSSFIRNKIIQYLNGMVHELLKDDAWSLNMVHRYIREHIHFMESWQENVKQLTKLDTIFQKFCYEPTLEIYQSMILSNEVIHMMLENIVESNLEILKKYGINVVTNDPMMIELIKEYCTYYGIDVQKDDDYMDKPKSQTKKTSAMDSVKMYLDDIPNSQPNFERDLQLLICAKNGEESAKKQLVENNLRLVVSIAKKYVGNGVPFLDLLQEGNLGLMKAIDMFDVSKGYKFSTYATWWIKRSITTIIAEQGNNFKLPTTMYDSLRKLKRMKQLLTQQSKQTPTIAELANALNVSEDKIIQLEQYQQQVNIVSLSSSIDQDENMTLESLIMDSSDLLEESITQFDLYIAVKQLIERCDSLLENEKKLLIMEFGLYGSKVQSQAEIGRKFGVTRARANAISKSALKKLRCSDEILTGGYAQFMDDPQKAEENIIMYRKKYMSERTYQRRYGSS